MPKLPEVLSLEGAGPGYHDCKTAPRLHTSTSTGGPMQLRPGASSGVCRRQCGRKYLASLSGCARCSPESAIFAFRFPSRSELLRARARCSELKGQEQLPEAASSPASVTRPCSSRLVCMSPPRRLSIMRSVSLLCQGPSGVSQRWDGSELSYC